MPLRVRTSLNASPVMRTSGRSWGLALFRGSTPGLDHYAFAIEGYSAAAAVEKLEAAGLKAKRRGNRVYFDDPDGIEVQVTAGGL